MLLICGDALSPDTLIAGLENSSIEVTYRQDLRRCDFDDRRPGMLLELQASRDSAPATFRLMSPDNTLACEQLIDSPPLAEPHRGQPAPPSFVNDMREEDALYIDVGGIRTRYFEKGRGDTLVLVHGGQPSAPDFNAWEWQQNLAGLAAQFRVIVPDRIGQGYTDNPSDLSAYENYYSLVVEHLLGFLDALELDQVHLVGHSQGGWPVTRIAIDHPGRVKSLTIVDSTMIARSSNAAAAVRFYMYHQNDLHPDSGPTRQSIRRGLESFSYTNNNITDQRIERILKLSRTEKFQQASDAFDRLFMSPAHPSFRQLKTEIWAELLDGKLRTPTLIIWGREDPEGSFPAGVAMFESLRDAGTPVSFRAFDKAGHVAYMEYPEEFNRALAEFVTANQSLPSMTSAQ